MTRFMVVTAPAAAGGGGRGAGGGGYGRGGSGGGRRRGGTPLKPFAPQEWTQFEVLIDGNVAKANLVGVAGSLGGGLAPMTSENMAQWRSSSAARAK